MNKDAKKLEFLYEKKVFKKININTKPDSEFDPKELELGIKVEMEHTNDKILAKSIAKDHLLEVPDYYTKLKKVEEKIHHCEKNICPKCKVVTNCKCSTPERVITHNICYYCENINI